MVKLRKIIFFDALEMDMFMEKAANLIHHGLELEFSPIFSAKSGDVVDWIRRTQLVLITLRLPYGMEIFSTDQKLISQIKILF